MGEPIRVGTPGAVLELPVLKAHCRVDGTDSDTVLALYLAAATDHVERFIGRALRATSWEVSYDSFPAAAITLPLGPVTEIDAITYFDSDGVAQTMSNADYRADLSAVEATISAIDAWPVTDGRAGGVKVQWTGGDAVCPDDLKVAILMLAGHMFENREAVVVGTGAAEIPMGPLALMQRHRRFRG